MYSNLSRRSKALLWLVAVAVLVGVLVALEMIALLYVFASLGLVVLLLVVSFTDLRDTPIDDRIPESEQQSI